MTRSKPVNRRKSRPHANWKTIAVRWTKDVGENMLIGYASMWGFPADSQGDVVRRGAFRKSIMERVNKGQVPLLDSHIYDAAHTIGTVIKAEEDETGLKIWAKLSTAPTAQDIKQKLIEGHIGKLSIGYDVVKESYGKDPETKKPVRFLNELKLFEISVVPIPASDRAKILQVKSMVPFQDLPLAGRNDDWDSTNSLARVREWAGGGSNIGEMNWTKYRRAFLWYDREDPEQVGSYKLPIADVMDGRLTAVPRGIFAAAAAMQGARGGVNIPTNDMDAIRDQINRYYAKMRSEFDDDTITAPWENKGGKAMFTKQLSYEGMTDEELITAWEQLSEMFVMFQDDESRVHIAEMAAPLYDELTAAGETLDSELGQFITEAMDNMEPTDDTEPMDDMEDLEGAALDDEQGTDPNESDDPDDESDDPERLGEKARRMQLRQKYMAANAKAGNRHNRKDRETIGAAVRALFSLLSHDEVHGLLQELTGEAEEHGPSGAEGEEDKGNNKPNAAQAYNRDEDYEAKPNSKSRSLTSMEDRKRKLNELKLKQFEGVNRL